MTVVEAVLIRYVGWRQSKGQRGNGIQPSFSVPSLCRANCRRSIWATELTTKLKPYLSQDDEVRLISGDGGGYRGRKTTWWRSLHGKTDDRTEWSLQAPTLSLKMVWRSVNYSTTPWKVAEADIVESSLLSGVMNRDMIDLISFFFSIVFTSNDSSHPLRDVSHPQTL